MAKLKRKQRTRLLLLGVVALALSTILVTVAIRDTIVFFFGPAELMAKEASGEIDESRRLRLGGLVVEGSVQRSAGETVSFQVTDNTAIVDVAFTGVLPDLFAEGQGVVAEGYYSAGAFKAESVLAKHDEKYMSREVADAIKASGQWKADNVQ